MLFSRDYGGIETVFDSSKNPFSSLNTAAVARALRLDLAKSMQPIFNAGGLAWMHLFVLLCDASFRDLGKSSHEMPTVMSTVMKVPS